MYWNFITHTLSLSVIEPTNTFLEQNLSFINGHSYREWNKYDVKFFTSEVCMLTCQNCIHISWKKKSSSLSSVIVTRINERMCQKRISRIVWQRTIAIEKMKNLLSFVFHAQNISDMTWDFRNNANTNDKSIESVIFGSMEPIEYFSYLW